LAPSTSAPVPPRAAPETRPSVAAPELPLDKQGARIQAMFGRVARRYDLLNHLLSASLDRLWRRRLARDLRLPAGSRVLDLCSGTGDQATALERRGYRVAAADFCLPMLALSRPKFEGAKGPRPSPLQADALALPFAAGRFDGATVSFGLRNVADLDRALAEIARVLRPGGELGVLEFTVPALPPLRALYLFYFRRLLPALGGWISGDPTAYAYLPESVLGFPQRDEFLARLEAAGFEAARYRSLSGGVLALYRARRSA
jgi:demethylmenaquinone methyltransferase/2-methoxy-6-polyprenyl-1,4-benzoquinol methylase